MRKARRGGLDILVFFSLEEAQKAEGAEKDAEVARRGVQVGLEDLSVASYWMAQKSRC